MIRILAILVLMFGAAISTARAVEPSEMMADPAQEARAREVSKSLRCVVCQNETIDESNAELAHDMRVLVRRRIAAGDSNAQVLQYMEQRYGDFVLLKPRFMSATLFLWLGPLAILVLGGVAIARMMRRARPAAVPLTADEAAALAKLDRDS
jgi:cytochrome c-type biogenesis protein CcmH